MDSTPRKIEIFAPFSAALDLTKLILFQPFDIAKWLVIGFAAFLAHLGGGGGNGFNFGRKLPGNAQWNVRSASQDAVATASGLPGWAIALIIVGAIVLVALVVVLLWVGSRGKFIFTDCVVRNRGAIVEPWREFRKEGNSLFVFSLLVGLALLLVLGLAAMPLWLPALMSGGILEGAALFGSIALFGMVAAVLLIGWSVISNFMLPVMYRRRCSATEGFQAALAMITAEPGPVILFVLFSVVLWIAFAMVACATTCLTCCITAIPYVGTVILLPAHVFFMSYLLLFVRQFGPDYDPWGNLVPTEPSPAALEPPSAEPPPFQV